MKNAKFIKIFFFYFVQSVPLYIFSGALPSILRLEGLDLSKIGSLSLVGLPWALKFLWAPKIEEWARINKKARKKLMIFFQIIIAASMYALYHFGIKTDFNTILVIGAFLSLASATQDIMLDALTCEMLDEKERSKAASIQSSSVALGALLGGGLPLMLYNSPYLNSVFLGTFALAIGSLAVYCLFRDDNIHQGEELDLISLKRSFSNDTLLKAIGLTIVLRLPETGFAALQNIALVDRGVAIEEIGQFLSLIAPIVGIIASLSLGKVMEKLHLTKATASLVLVRTMVYLSFYLTLLFGKTEHLVLIAAIQIALRYCTLSLLNYSYLTASSKMQSGTDFTLLACSDLFVYILMSFAFSKLAHTIGIENTLLISLILGPILASKIFIKSFEGRLQFKRPV